MVLTLSRRLRDQMTMQLGFLERSAVLYDAGYIEEAVRIAVTIRVVLHESHFSHSLIRQLDKGMTRLLSTCMLPSAAPVRIYPEAVGIVTATHGLAIAGLDGLHAALEAASASEYLPAVDWWSQPIYRFADSDTLTRRDVVLVAANKDGGAHVDPNLPKQYVQLIECDEICSFLCESTGHQWQQVIKAAHYAALRQMAYELLHSPDLREPPEHGMVAEKSA